MSQNPLSHKQYKPNFVSWLVQHIASLPDSIGMPESEIFWQATEDRSQAIWCTNEESCLLRSALSIHIISSLPTQRSQWGMGKVRSQPYFWNWWVDRKIRPGERLLQSLPPTNDWSAAHRYVSVLTANPILFYLKHCKHGLSLTTCYLYFVGSRCNANGHSPETLVGRKSIKSH